MNSPVAQLIRSEIRERGIIPFSRFMELALYAPGLGYYETRDPVGRKGDFYTSVSAGPLFGRLLARQCAQWLKPGHMIVEAGANNGQLAADILNALRESAPGFSSAYTIIEPSSTQRARQQETLRGFTVSWVSSLTELGPLRGILLSNELLDAMPVNVWQWNRAQRHWLQLGVGLRDEALVWQPIPSSHRAALPWIDLPADLLELLPDGFKVEEHTVAAAWWKQAAGLLTEGHILAFDYGFEAEEAFRPERAGGTLRAYAKHRSIGDVLENPGLQDITAHVNFSAIKSAGEQAGLTTLFDDTQARLLHDIAAEWMRQSPDEWDSKMARQFQTLTHPDHLGRGFRALLQARSTEKGSSVLQRAGLTLPV